MSSQVREPDNSQSNPALSLNTESVGSDKLSNLSVDFTKSPDERRDTLKKNCKHHLVYDNITNDFRCVTCGKHESDVDLEFLRS